MFKRKKGKFLITILTLMLITMVTNTVNAASVELDVSWHKISDSVGKIIVEQYGVDYTWFCGEKHETLYNGTYKFNIRDQFTVSKDENSDYADIAYIFSYFGEQPINKNILGEDQISIDDITNEDYVALQECLWNSKVNGNLFNTGTNYNNLTTKAKQWKAEGKAYKSYLEKLKNNYTNGNDIYVVGKTENIDTKTVDTNAKTILLGTFSVDYLYATTVGGNAQGENVDREIMFSGIEDIIVYNAATGDRIEGVKFIRNDGTIIGEQGGYQYPLPNEEFKIEVPENDATDIKIKVKFKYVSDIQAKFQRYRLNKGSITEEDQGFQDLMKFYNSSVQWGEKEIEFEIPGDDPKWEFEINKKSADREYPINAKFRINIHKSNEKGELGELIAGSDSVEIGKWTQELSNGERKRIIEELRSVEFVKIMVYEDETTDGYKTLNKPIQILIHKDPNSRYQIKEYQITGPGIYNTSVELEVDEEGIYKDSTKDFIDIYNSPEAQKVVLNIENEIDPPDPEEFKIRINKIYGTKPLDDAEFDIVLRKWNNEVINSWSEVTNDDGIIWLKDIGLADGGYELEISEENAPSGYYADYYSYKIGFEVKKGKIDKVGTVLAKRNKLTKEYGITLSNSQKNDLVEIEDNFIDIYIENSKSSGSFGSGRRSYGYDVILNKVLVNGEDTSALENVKFDIVMKDENGQKVDDWTKTTSSKGKLNILSNCKKTGTYTLEITEKLTSDQKTAHSIQMEGLTKQYTIEFTAEKYTSGRNTYYYISSFAENDSAVILEGPDNVKNADGTDELLVTIENIGKDPIDVGMDIAGVVFLDGLDGKSGQNDNAYESTDKLLENIEVTLLNAETGSVVAETKTDERGRYEFIELNPMKQYKVKFTYNGQDYEDTEAFYGTNFADAVNTSYNTDTWNQYSKATENAEDRNAVTNRFKDIGDYPNSYTRPDGSTNPAYSKHAISEMYELLAGNTDSDLLTADQKQQMQNYIDDCKVSAVTDAYPALSKFSLDDEDGNTITFNPENGSYYESKAVALYEGQHQINFGLRLMPELDLRISDTVSNIDVEVNGKKETYNCGELADAIAYLRTFDIQRNQVNADGKLPTEDGIAYYGSADNLDIYVTHKIRITNESETVATVKEFIEYYDSRYYTFVGAYKDKECTEVNQYSSVEDLASNGNYGAKKISGFGIELGNGDVYFVYVKLKLNGNGKANASEVLSQDANLLAYDGKVVAGRTTSNMNYVEISGYYTNIGLVDRDSIAGSFDPTAYEAASNERDLIEEEYKIRIDSASSDEEKRELQQNMQKEVQLELREELKDTYSDHLIYLAEDDTSGALATFKTLTEDDPSTTETIEPDYNSRTLSGNVFEDLRANLSKEDINTNEVTDSEMSNKIAGVTVELVEILQDNTYVTRAKTETDGNGTYTFKDYIPGNYVIRFTYGDKVYTVGGNDAIYNGQDYQSTYANPNTNATTYWYTDTKKYSDAYDKVQDREKVIKYANESLVSDEVGSGLSLNYYKTESLKNVDYNSGEDYMKELIKANTMEAYTSTLELEVENATTSTASKSDVTYDISNVDFGLVKRAESKMTLEQHLSHLTITQSDGSILVDTPVTIETNVLGQPEIKLESGSDKVHFQYVGTKNSYGVGTAKLEIDDEILIGNIDLEYTITVRNDTPKETTLTYYENADGIVAIGYYEEETDKLVYWEENGIRYYNSSDVEIKQNVNRRIPEVVTTKVENIINYVSTNLNFDSVKNGEDSATWELLTNPETTLRNVNASGDLNYDNRTAVNNEAYKEYNQVLLAKGGNILLNTELRPGNEIKEHLVLSATNTQDVDLNYYNIAEILELENSAGRVDTFSTPGNLNPVTDYTDYNKYSSNVLLGELKEYDYNQDGIADRTGLDEPTADGTIDRYSYEPDSTKAEHVLITDATGDTHYYYALIGAVLVIFAAGIVLIKKFVLNKKV